jgi:hypothetical protein
MIKSFLYFFLVLAQNMQSFAKSRALVLEPDPV